MNPSIRETHPSRRTRPIAIGVAAGVLAGGAIGLVAVGPAFTNAASEDTTAVAADTTIATSPTGAPTQDGAASEPSAADRPEPGERLRDALQPLVDDGTIDTSQADAVAEFLVENRPDGPPGQRGRRGLDGHGPDRAVLAGLLGIDADTLRAELSGGASIADIAEEHGVDVQTVIDGLVADARTHLDVATAHGLDEDQAAERLEQLTARIEAGVYRTRQAGAPTDDG